MTGLDLFAVFFFSVSFKSFYTIKYKLDAMNIIRPPPWKVLIVLVAESECIAIELDQR